MTTHETKGGTESPSREVSSDARFINLHVLYSFAGANPNRDDVGEPKTLVYGGVTRGRMSSQAMTRAKRLGYENDCDGERGIRSKSHSATAIELVMERLSQAGPVSGDMQEIVERVVSKKLDGLSSSKEKEKGSGGEDGEGKKTTTGPKAVAAFISESELARLVELSAVEACAISASPKDPKAKVTDDVLLVAAALATKKVEEARGFGCLSGPDAPAVLSEIVSAIPNMKRPGKAADVKAALTRFLVFEGNMANATTTTSLSVAAFGRMFANAPEFNTEAAVQRASAFATHPSIIEMDYFSTVDDLAPAEQTGADHIGVKQFTGGVYYWHANIDVEQLRKNFPAGRFPSREQLEVFARSLLLNLPTGNQTTAPVQSPVVFAMAHASKAPTSLAAAFETPVEKDEVGGYVPGSIEALVEECRLISKSEPTRLAGPKLYAGTGAERGGDRADLQRGKLASLGFEKVSVDGLAGAIASWIA